MSDRLRTRLFRIMTLLLEENDYLTLQQLADELGISKRTMQNDLERLEEWLEESGFSDRVALVKKPGNGISVQLTDISMRELKSWLEERYSGNSLNDNYERRLEIAKFLLFSHDDLTVQFLADQFYTSKSVVQKDLPWVEKWLLQYGLGISKRQNRGVSICGSEQKRRAAMVGLIELMGASRGSRADCDVDVSTDVDIIRLDLERFYSGLNSNPKADVGKIAEIIHCAEKTYHFYLMDSYYTGLLVHLAIAIERLVGGKGVSDNDTGLEDIMKTREGEIATYISQAMEEVFHVCVPDSERSYICIHIMGAEQSDPGAEENETHSSRIGNFTKQFVAFVESVTGTRFQQDEILLKSLAAHVKTSVFRLRSGLSRQTHYLKHIPLERERLYRAVWAGGYYYKQFFGIEPTNDELVSVYLHFVHSLRRRTQRCKTLYIYQCDIIKAEEVYAKLCTLSDEVEIVDICCWGQRTSEMLDSYDLVITTARNVDCDVPLISVSTPVTARELEEIRRTATQIIRARVFEGQCIPSKGGANIVWMPLAHKNIEGVFEALFDLLTKHGFNAAALARESLELERDGRTLVMNDVAFIPLYLPDISSFCAYGFTLPSSIPVIDGTASRIVFVLLDEPERMKNREDDLYPPFISHILQTANPTER